LHHPSGGNFSLSETTGVQNNPTFLNVPVTDMTVALTAVPAHGVAAPLSLAGLVGVGRRRSMATLTSRRPAAGVSPPTT
jgi:hypothetical protein